MYKIAICDDEQAFVRSEQRVIERIAKRNRTEIEVTRFYRGRDLLRACRKCENLFDMIFLDLKMPDLDGFQTAQIFRELDPHRLTLIVAVTSVKEYFSDAMRMQPFRFILKAPDPNPFTDRVEGEIEEAIRAGLQEMKRTDFESMTVRTDARETVRLSYRSILYFKSDKRILTAHTMDGDVSFYGKISDYEDRTKKHLFVPCYKGYLVNVRFVYRLSADNRTLIMRDNSEVPVSRSNIRAVKDAMMSIM